MPATRTRNAPVSQPSLITAPICPCELLPGGLPGLVEIGGTMYGLALHAELPESGEPVVLGYRLSKADGTSYDVPADLRSCECADHLYRRRECKHLRSLRLLRDADLIP